ncbi:MAG: class I SAM-dependent methyltransferase [Bifidobacterium sp.]|jgi:SAM-dependent methyltransferase
MEPSREQEYWNTFYAEHTLLEHANVGPILVEQTSGLKPLTALDLGCGEGSDAIWLARKGWNVLAVDLSQNALDRARDNCERAGVQAVVTFRQFDLSRGFPDGSYALVSAQFLHSPVARPGERGHILARAAAAVESGGDLLIVSHWTMPQWHRHMPDSGEFGDVDVSVPTPEQTRAAVRIPGVRWATVRDEMVTAVVSGPENQTGERQDHVLHLRRIF